MRVPRAGKQIVDSSNRTAARKVNEVLPEEETDHLLRTFFA